MRELGERGKGGFEGGELEMGDGHGENPSFSSPSPSSFWIACFNFFFSLSLPILSVGKATETNKFGRAEKPDNASSTVFYLCLNGKAFLVFFPFFAQLLCYLYLY